MNTSPQRGSERRPVITPVRVVVADDSESFGALASALLDCEPCVEVVGLAHSGGEALEMVIALTPDLVLMDVQMRPMSGLTAAALIWWLFPKTRVVLMSTEDSPRLRAECTACGAEAFIHKPALISEFIVAAGPIARDLVRERHSVLESTAVAQARAV